MVLALVDAGKLSLDDKVSQYIPDFTKYNKSYITIRHCLSHQTGIKQEPIKLAAFLLRKKYETLEQEVNEFVSKREIDYNPGEAFFYGNVGMNIAARVCEVAGNCVSVGVTIDGKDPKVFQKDVKAGVYDAKFC